VKRSDKKRVEGYPPELQEFFTAADTCSIRLEKVIKVTTPAGFPERFKKGIKLLFELHAREHGAPPLDVIFVEEGNEDVQDTT